MRVALVALLVVHGLLHLMGFAKAFGLAALVASQAAIVSSWSDAKYGTLANVAVLLAVVGPPAYRNGFRTAAGPPTTPTRP